MCGLLIFPCAQAPVPTSPLKASKAYTSGHQGCLLLTPPAAGPGLLPSVAPVGWALSPSVRPVSLLVLVECPERRGGPGGSGVLCRPQPCAAQPRLPAATGKAKGSPVVGKAVPAALQGGCEQLCSDLPTLLGRYLGTVRLPLCAAPRPLGLGGVVLFHWPGDCVILLGSGHQAAEGLEPQDPICGMVSMELS